MNSDEKFIKKIIWIEKNIETCVLAMNWMEEHYPEFKKSRETPIKLRKFNEMLSKWEDHRIDQIY